MRIAASTSTWPITLMPMPKIETPVRTDIDGRELMRDFQGLLRHIDDLPGHERLGRQPAQLQEGDVAAQADVRYDRGGNVAQLREAGNPLVEDVEDRLQGVDHVVD